MTRGIQGVHAGQYFSPGAIRVRSSVVFRKEYLPGEMRGRGRN